MFYVAHLSIFPIDCVTILSKKEEFTFFLYAVDETMDSKNK